MGSVRKCLISKSSNPVVRRTLLCALLLIAAGTVSAQQAYNNVSGYACTGQSTTCTSYAFYRTQSSTETLSSVASLFNTTASSVANSSGITLTSAPLAQDTPLYIDLPCSCTKSTYQSDVTHQVIAGDTFAIIANSTYEGLTTYQAIEAANPTINVTNLQIGQSLTIPLRCACPTTSQLTAGHKILLTYVIYPLETFSNISTRLNVSISDLESANDNVNVTTLEAFTTILVPLAALPSQSSAITPVASPPTNSSSSSAISRTSHSNNIALFIGVAIGASGLLLGSNFGAF